jgi:hypothetical protein
MGPQVSEGPASGQAAREGSGVAVESTWERVELPILEQMYEAENSEPPLYLSFVANGQASSTAEEIRAAERLIAAGYLEGKPVRAMGGVMFDLRAKRLTEKGLRAVGAWPSPSDGREAFLAALQQAIDSTDDPEERTRLEKLRSAAGEVTKASFVAVLSAAARAGLGLG